MHKRNGGEPSSDTAKPGELIKQHYQGGAFFQVAKSSLLIPIPCFALLSEFISVCVRESNKCLYCTIGRKTVWCPCVFSPFHGNPAGHVRCYRITRAGWDESPDLTSLSHMTTWAQQAWTWAWLGSRTKALAGLWMAIKPSKMAWLA